MGWKYYLLKITGLISSLFFWLVPWINGVTDVDASLAHLFSVPGLIVLLLPRRFLELARGGALAQSSLLCVAAINLLALTMGSPQHLDKSVGQIVLGFVVQLCFGLSALLIDGWPRKGGLTIQFGIGAAISLLLLGGSFGRMMTNQTSWGPEHVYGVIACEETYKAARGGQYADSLLTLASAQGKNCIYPYSIRGNSDYGKIKFQALHSGDGHVAGYSIIFGARTFWGRFSPGGYTDQTGIIHISQDHRVASGADPVASNVTTFLHEWSQCLTKQAREHPDVPFPAELKSMTQPDWPCRPIWNVEENHINLSDSYLVDYYRDSPDGPKPRAAFHLLARPYRYAFTGVRHYYVDETGIIRGTPAERDATREDLPIPECEWVEHKACS